MIPGLSPDISLIHGLFQDDASQIGFWSLLAIRHCSSMSGSAILTCIHSHRQSGNGLVADTYFSKLTLFLTFGYLLVWVMFLAVWWWNWTSIHHFKQYNISFENIAKQRTLILSSLISIQNSMFWLWTCTYIQLSSPIWFLPQINKWSLEFIRAFDICGPFMYVCNIFYLLKPFFQHGRLGKNLKFLRYSMWNLLLRITSFLVRFCWQFGTILSYFTND